jgi:hypothetical protein
MRSRSAVRSLGNIPGTTLSAASRGGHGARDFGTADSAANAGLSLDRFL